MDRFIRRAESSGWTLVRLSKSGGLTSLCEYTRVSGVHEKSGRTYFVIADGYVGVGQEASLSTANAAKYLSAGGPSGAAFVKVVYDGPPKEEVSPYKGKLKQQWAKLSFDGQTVVVTLNSIWDRKFTPIPPGTHSILAPDYSHSENTTAGYAQDTVGMVGNDVWFPIGLFGSSENSSRYIHVGHLSDGCVTVHQLERWTALYQYLISRRVSHSGGKRVGSLVVSK